MNYVKVIIGMLVGAATLAAVPTSNEPLIGRMVQQAGTSGQVSLDFSGPEGYELVLGSNTKLPEDMELSQNGNLVVLNCNAPSAGGTFNAVLDLRFNTPVPIEGWTGPMLEMQYVRRIEWHCLPPVTDPFGNGIGDIIITPIP